MESEEGWWQNSIKELNIMQKGFEVEFRVFFVT